MTGRLCGSCKNHTKCRKICKPLEEWLRANGSTARFYEKYTSGNMAILYESGHGQPTRFSEVVADFETDAVHGVVESVADPNQSNRPDFALLEKDEAEIEDVKPTTQLAKVFFKRFFEGKSTKEAAEELGLPYQSVVAYYHTAKKRMIQASEDIGTRKSGYRFIADGFSMHEKIFLLNRVFGFTSDDIASLQVPGWPRNRNHINLIVKTLSKKYRKDFLTEATEGDNPKAKQCA